MTVATLPSSDSLSGQATTQVKVNLIRHAPLSVSYDEVESLLPKLMETHQPDVTLCIGLAANRSYFAPELSAGGTGYNARDVNGKLYGKDRPHGRLVTTLPYDALVEDWIGKVKTISVTPDKKDSTALFAFSGDSLRAEARKSDDAGLYLCEFSYHVAQSYYLEYRHKAEDSPTTPKIQEDRQPGGPALFLHIPKLPTPAHITLGAQVAEALIESMVRGLLSQEVHGQ